MLRVGAIELARGAELVRSSQMRVVIRAGWPLALVGVIVLGAGAAVLLSRHVEPPPMDQLSYDDLHPPSEPRIVKPEHVVPQPELPPWFGDPAGTPVVIEGRVVGVTEPTTVRLAVDGTRAGG